MDTFSDLLRDYLVCNIWQDAEQAVEDLRANGMTEYAATVAVEDHRIFMRFNASNGELSAATEKGGEGVNDGPTTGSNQV